MLKEKYKKYAIFLKLYNYNFLNDDFVRILHTIIVKRKTQLSENFYHYNLKLWQTIIFMYFTSLILSVIV